ncbi:MAG: serine/threonine protein kinase [Lentisphaeria bacterium]|nr:serine/threonine protein kinase [Lentisphaeria bacterium]
MPTMSQELRQRFAELEIEMRTPGSVLFSQTRYEIVRLLGEGGMGITFLAHEISAADLKRPVVLKFVRDSLDSHRLSRFIDEVQLSILFNHPNLLPVYRLESEAITLDTGRSVLSRGQVRQRGHTVYYAVMQYIDGWNLRQIANRLRHVRILLNQDLTMFVIGRICRGLHYVHEYRDEAGEKLELVHRDVSPENILVDRFGRIKVSDFGIAMSTKKLRNGVFLQAGNLRYCAPEQLTGAPLSRRCDIYNVGLLLYFLFTNTDRFGPEVREKDARDRIRRKMARSPLPDLGHVHPRCAAICDVCLRQDPSQRYQNCEDIANDIDIYFQETQKVVTNEQLEEMLLDLFSPDPHFVSRRFVPLTGSDALAPQGFDPGRISDTPEPAGPVSTAIIPPDPAD